MKGFAEVAIQIPRSGIREILELATSMQDVIHLEIGQPDFDTPPHIVEATCKYANEGHTKYVPNAGVDALRDAAARYFTRTTGIATEVENILVTPGAAVSLTTAFVAILDIGDEVLVPDPGWPNYSMAVSLAHGNPVAYNLRPENQFLPDVEEMQSLVTSKTKILLICSPSNPTGQVYNKEAMSKLMAFAKEHDLYLLSDEIYAEIVFDEEHVSALACDDDQRSLVINGMSKSFSMTGYRVAFTRAHPDYVMLGTKLQEAILACGTGFSQLAAAVGLDSPMDCVYSMRDIYKSRRNVAVEVLKEYDLHRYTPGGAFYLLVEIGSTGMDSHAFAMELLQNEKVAVAPGSTFGTMGSKYIRISFATPEAQLREGLHRLCRFIRSKD